jgi:hypothetical protein
MLPENGAEKRFAGMTIPDDGNLIAAIESKLK